MKRDTDALLWFSIDTRRTGRKQIILILKVLISFFFTQKTKFRIKIWNSKAFNNLMFAHPG